MGFYNSTVVNCFKTSQMNPTFTMVLESCIRYDLLLVAQQSPDTKYLCPYQSVALTWLWCHLLVDGIQKWPMFVLCRDLPYPTALIISNSPLCIVRISKSIVWICQISRTMSRVLVIINNVHGLLWLVTMSHPEHFLVWYSFWLYILYLKQLFLFFQSFPNIIPSFSHQ